MSTQQPAEKSIPFLALGGKFGEDHLQYKVLTGTTHATPGTAVTVAHGLDATPSLFFVRKGNGYIDAVSATTITIKSAVASQALEVVVIY